MDEFVLHLGLQEIGATAPGDRKQMVAMDGLTGMVLLVALCTYVCRVFELIGCGVALRWVMRCGVCVWFEVWNYVRAHACMNE